MITQTCSDCGIELERPLTENANYVAGGRFTDTSEVEIHYAMVHTEETKKRLNKMDRLLPTRGREALSAEMAHPDAPESVDVPAGSEILESESGATRSARTREFPFSIPVDEFDVAVVDSPNTVQGNEEIALVITEVEKREQPVSALLCSDCTEADDEIAWGVDE